MQDLMLMTPVWAVLEYDIAAAVYGGLKAFWAVMRRKAGSGQDFVLPPPEVYIHQTLPHSFQPC